MCYRQCRIKILTDMQAEEYKTTSVNVRSAHSSRLYGSRLPYYADGTELGCSKLHTLARTYLVQLAIFPTPNTNV